MYNSGSLVISEICIDSKFAKMTSTILLSNKSHLPVDTDDKIFSSSRETEPFVTLTNGPKPTSLKDLLKTIYFKTL